MMYKPEIVENKPLIRRLKPTANDKAQMLQTADSKPYPLLFALENGLIDKKIIVN